MSEIHINRGGQNLGIFTETEVQEGLNVGKYLGTDLAWRATMENWKPLAQWTEFTIPLDVPAAAAGSPPVPEFPPALLGDLPSWENKAEIGFANALGATVKEVLLAPEATFRRMKEMGGLTTPFLFMLIATMIGLILTVVLQFGMQAAFGGMSAPQNPEMAKIFAQLGSSSAVGFAFLLILVPIGIFVGSFIGSALWHGALLMLGGANKPYEATYRVYCYCKGATSLVSLVPCCGPVAAPIWTIVAGSIGLSKVHGISTGKALLAILLPLIFCCSLCGVGLYFLIHGLQTNQDFMNALNSFKNR